MRSMGMEGAVIVNLISRKKAMKIVDECKRSEKLLPVPMSAWPEVYGIARPSSVFLSHKFMVQVHSEENGIIRLSINLIAIDENNRFIDGITWEEIQQIKRECGYADSYAIEIYPREEDVVNVANFRHIWILPEPLPIGWFSE